MRRIANTGDAIGMERLAGRDCLVVMEATGCYDAVLRTALGHADVRHARVNPAQARHFARATGRRAGENRRGRCAHARRPWPEPGDPGRATRRPRAPASCQL